MKPVPRLLIACWLGLLTIGITFILCLISPEALSTISFIGLFWAQWIVRPVLEPHFIGRTGMLDGPYRMILWASSLLIELIVYTAFFYVLMQWHKKRSLKAISQLP